MPERKTRPRVTARLAKYRGKQTNSSGFRFEGALFKNHPEFNGEVTAHILAPGRMLVTAGPHKRKGADPVMAAFVAFLAQDVAAAPQHIRPLDFQLAKRIDRLVEGIQIDPAQKLAGEVGL